MKTTVVMRDFKDYMDFKDAKKFIKVAENLRDKALFTLLVMSGRRVSEIISLKVKDIDFQNQTINFPILKKKKKTRVPIFVGSVPILILSKYIEQYKLTNEDWLFPSRSRKGRHITRQFVHKLVKYYSTKYGIYAKNGKPPHPHTFRHTYATYFAKKYQTIEEIKALQYLLQHSDIDMTLYYIQVHSRTYKDFVERVLFNAFAEKEE